MVIFLLTSALTYLFIAPDGGGRIKGRAEDVVKKIGVF